MVNKQDSNMRIKQKIHEKKYFQKIKLEKLQKKYHKTYSYKDLHGGSAYSKNSAKNK